MSTDFLKKDKRALWHPFDIFPDVPTLFVQKSEGTNLYTSDGRIIKDMVSSWWVNLHGHNHPHIVKAIQQQAETLSHVIFSGFTHEPAITLAERLLAILPTAMHKVFLSDNGSTAVEVGLKMALQFWYNLGQDRTELLAFEGCYHGDTFGAMSLAGPEPFNQPFEKHLFKVTYLPFPTTENWEQVSTLLHAKLEKGKVAALVYEPLIQGVGGMRLFDRLLQERILDLCKQHHVLLIADEVMTGFGRTGKLFASEYLTTQPDIICLSKGITGGFLPLGATAASAMVVEAFQQKEKRKIFLHGHSYTGNALACAAANASLDLLLSKECRSSIASISDSQAAFAKELETVPSLNWSVSLGTILSINRVPSQEKGYFDTSAEHAYHYFLQKNILLRPMGNSLYLSPPYCTTQDELASAQQAIKTYLLE